MFTYLQNLFEKHGSFSCSLNLKHVNYISKGGEEKVPSKKYMAFSSEMMEMVKSGAVFKNGSKTVCP